MGHRANFVVVDHDGWQLYYAKHGALGSYTSLAAGPDTALTDVRRMTRVESPDGWLDDVWSEGGAVIDTVAQRLLWYGDEITNELPTRRVAMRLLAETWPGWRVDWAYDGIGDLAAYVGVDRAIVRELDMSELTAAPFVRYDIDTGVQLYDYAGLPVDQQGAYELVEYELVTVVTADGVRAWMLHHEFNGHLAWLGPALLDQLPGPGFDRLSFTDLPDAGLHIDLPAREVGIWTSDICPGLLPVLDTRWPGWTTTFWQDRYERQLAAADHAVLVPDWDERQALDQIAKYLFPQSPSRQRTSPPALDTEIVGRDRTADTNPAIRHHTDTQLEETHLQRLAQAVRKLATNLADSRD